MQILKAVWHGFCCAFGFHDWRWEYEEIQRTRSFDMDKVWKIPSSKECKRCYKREDFLGCYFEPHKER